MNDKRNWITIELAADKLNCNTEAVNQLIEAGRLQTKRDDFGGLLVGVASLEAVTGKVVLRGVS